AGTEAVADLDVLGRHLVARQFGGVGGVFVAIRVLGRYEHAAFVADFHCEQMRLQPRDDLSTADKEREGFAARRRVQRLAGVVSECVVEGNNFVVHGLVLILSWNRQYRSSNGAKRHFSSGKK